MCDTDRKQAVKDEQSHKPAKATPAGGHRGGGRLGLDGQAADRRPGAGEGGEDVSHGKGGSVSTEASQHHSFC